jgi:hypothetical protein
MSEAPAGGELEMKRTGCVGQLACALAGRSSNTAGAASKVLRVSLVRAKVRALDITKTLEIVDEVSNGREVRKASLGPAAMSLADMPKRLGQP